MVAAITYDNSCIEVSLDDDSRDDAIQAANVARRCFPPGVRMSVHLYDSNKLDIRPVKRQPGEDHVRRAASVLEVLISDSGHTASKSYDEETSPRTQARLEENMRRKQGGRGLG